MKSKGRTHRIFTLKRNSIIIFNDNWASFLEVYPQKFEKRFGELKEYQITAVEKLLECSNPHNVFSYVECSNESYGNSYVVLFSCKSEICPSCSEKQVLEFSDWVTNEVLFIVDYTRTTKKVTIKFRRKDFDDKHKGYSTETMSALELIARLIQHIHYPKMHYTKYFGQYSVKRRGMRRKQEKLSNPNDTFKNRKEYRSSLAKLIWKVYGKAPLECSLCGCEMKVKEIFTENVDN